MANHSSHMSRTPAGGRHLLRTRAWIMRHSANFLDPLPWQLDWYHLNTIPSACPRTEVFPAAAGEWSIAKQKWSRDGEQESVSTPGSPLAICSSLSPSIGTHKEMRAAVYTRNSVVARRLFPKNLSGSRFDTACNSFGTQIESSSRAADVALSWEITGRLFAATSCWRIASTTALQCTVGVALCHRAVLRSSLLRPLDSTATNSFAPTTAS
mmetsp:Transcript_99836/g.279581  ORF Transcript_99836/g.279581 Transcript_99836/m.279581 type:complete len:211 (-) Transcript_99836:715-1347(-)